MTHIKPVSEKKAIILDNEWVLVKNDWNLVARLFSETFGTKPLTGKQFKQALKLYDQSQTNPLYQHNRGNISSDEFWLQVLNYHKIPTTNENIEFAKGVLEQLTTNVEETSIEAVKNIFESQNYELIMLSNSTPDIRCGNMKRHNYFQWFAQIYFSFETGYRKPEKGAYENILRARDLKPQNCIFVDDKEENLEGAKAAGIHVVKYKIGDKKTLQEVVNEKLCELSWEQI
ncbi:HAD-IA family hydrolase [Candidatus Woesearchaeota archaeon]|jgi:HAD superfamily hydrolase (TIGR01509 family)|nr:HAD-IA family hydrolase [Candidatus Woesearchaeota archaeon]